MTTASVSLGVKGPLRDQWFAVACEADVAQTPPAGVKLLGRDLVLWRSPGGALVAAPDQCTHSKGELSKGEVNDGLLACPKHGWTFGDEGRCVFKPSNLPINERAHLHTFPCSERYGLIWVALEDPATPLIGIPTDSDENARRIHTSTSTWRSNPIRIVSALLAQPDSPFENLTADVPFVVHGTFTSDDGVEHRRLLACAPADNRSSTVASVVWTSGDNPERDARIVATACSDLDAVRTAAESEIVPLPTIEITADEHPGVAAWKHQLLEFVRRDAA